MMRSSRQWGEVSNNINWLLCVAAFPTLLCDCTVDFEIFFFLFFFFCGVSILGQGGARQTFMDEGNIVWGGCYRMQRGRARSPKYPKPSPNLEKHFPLCWAVTATRCSCCSSVLMKHELVAGGRRGRCR